MFKQIFSYKNPEELKLTLIETIDAKYNHIFKDLNITLTVVSVIFQINTKIGVSRTRLENIVNTVKAIFDSVR